MGKHATFLHQRLGHAPRQNQTAHGDVTGGQALGDRQGVGLETECLMREPFAGATETTNHFVGTQQHVVFAADALNFRPVTLPAE